MAKKPGVWGIDLGQCALKALRLEEVDGEVVATAFDYVEHPKILSQPDAEPDRLIKEALDTFLSRNPYRGDIVAISVPGQSGLARFVKLPPVEEKKINDIVKFEARQQIPFPLHEVVWDFQKLGSGTVTDGFAMETEIGLFAIKRDTVNKYLHHFQSVDLEVHIVQMAPLALCNYVSYDLLNITAQAVEEGATPESDEKSCVVALDIGVDASNLVVTDGGSIIWQRPIPIGGNHFTRALTKDLKLTFAKAEHLKRNATKAQNLPQILKALRPVLNDFVGEIQRSLGYFTSTHRQAKIEYLVGMGNAFRLPGLQRFLSEKLQLEVRKVQTLEHLRGDGVIQAPAYMENVLTFPVAYGLAVQGLALPRLLTNLLPEEIRFDRMIRSKKPWGVAAAAALMLGTTAMTFAESFQYHSVTDDSIVKALEGGKQSITEAKKWESAYAAKMTDIAANEQAVKSILAGQYERANWVKLNQFISDCLPTVDNLPKDQVATYATEKAKAAQAATDQQLASANPKAVDPREEENRLSELVQVNVEAVLPLYSESLKGYYEYLKDPFNKENAGFKRMEEVDRLNPPVEDKGWLVELRGYTFHKGKHEFLYDTLVKNLATRNRNLTAAAAGGGQPGTAPQAVPAAPNPAAPNAPAPAGVPPVKPGEVFDPIKDRVSHAVLFQYRSTPYWQPGKFELINKSFGAAMATAAPATQSPTGQPGTSGSTLSNSSSVYGWQPLGNPPGQTGALAAGAYAAPVTPTTGTPFNTGPGPTTPAPPPGGRTDPGGAERLERTEFIVMFIWREVTPSDELMTVDGANTNGVVASKPRKSSRPMASRPGMTVPAGAADVGGAN